VEGCTLWCWRVLELQNLYARTIKIPTTTSSRDRYCLSSGWRRSGAHLRAHLLQVFCLRQALLRLWAACVFDGEIVRATCHAILMIVPRIERDARNTVAALSNSSLKSVEAEER